MKKFEVVENKLGMIYNYGFNKLADAIAYADKDWERLTYLEQTEDYEEFYILICEDPDEESLNHFNGDVFKDYKLDAVLVAMDPTDPHVRISVMRNNNIIAIVDTIKDFIEFRDNVYMAEIATDYSFKDDIKFEFITEREEPEKAEPVIDYNELTFELMLIKRALQFIIKKYGFEYVSVDISKKPEHEFEVSTMSKNGVNGLIELIDNDSAISSLQRFFERVEKECHHE